MLPITRNLLTHPRTRPALRNKMQYTLRALSALVIHWTANSQRGADAAAHQRYFNRGLRSASAHFVVDDHSIVQCLPESEVGFHCGDKPLGQYKPAGRAMIGSMKRLTPNYFTIGLELCVNTDGDWAKTYRNGVELAAFLLLKNDLEINQMLRHYDITGKDCPRMMIDDEAWKKFQDAVLAETIVLAQQILWRAHVTAKGLNVRSGPGTSYTIRHEIAQGDPVLGFELVNGWANIGPGEWVNANYLAPAAW